MQVECWMRSRADGTGRGKGSHCRPSTANLPMHPACCSSSEEQCSGLVGLGPSPLHKCCEEATQEVRYGLQEADRPEEMRRERLYIQLVTDLLNHALSVSSSLARTPALHASGSFWVKTWGCSTLCWERWPDELPLDCLCLGQWGELPKRKTCLMLSAPSIQQKDLSPGRACQCHQEQWQLPLAHAEHRLIHHMARPELLALLLSDLPLQHPPLARAKPSLLLL